MAVICKLSSKSGSVCDKQEGLSYPHASLHSVINQQVRGTPGMGSDTQASTEHQVVLGCNEIVTSLPNASIVLVLFFFKKKEEILSEGPDLKTQHLI